MSLMPGINQKNNLAVLIIISRNAKFCDNLANWHFFNLRTGRSCTIYPEFISSLELFGFHLQLNMQRPILKVIYDIAV